MTTTKIYKRIKQKIYPNKEQELLINQTFGCSRKVWNLLLSDYNNIGKLNEVSFYKKQDQYSYLKNVDSLALANEKLSLQKALKHANTFNKGKPHFKNKFSKQSYTTNFISNNIKILHNNIKLPKIKTPIKTRTKRFEKEKSKAKLKAATILKDKTDVYYVSLLFEYEIDILNQDEILNKIDKNNSIGLDLGLLDFLVDSNNNHIKPLKKELKPLYDKLKKEQRKLSNKLKANTKEIINNKPVYKKTLNICSNIRKQKIKIAKLYKKIHNKIKDFANKLSFYYIKNYDIISIEDLKISNMLKNHKLARSIQQKAWGMFTRMLEHKAYWNNKLLVKIDTYYPSSKTCSICGNIQNITLNERVYHCNNCSTSIDRDYNAAININNEGRRILNI